MLQQVDLAPSSRGENPRSAAHSIHKADAVPDSVVLINDREAPFGQEAQSKNMLNDVPNPETVTTKVGSRSTYGKVSGTEAYIVR